MQVLHHLNKVEDPNVLVGFNSLDDAGVYKLREDLAIVQTIDFFPPVVDDPYFFGAIACANALSDIYAMGARPVSALNIVGFPTNKLPLEVLEEILKGSGDKAKEAKVAIIGGHMIKTREPLYGLTVTGLIHPEKIVRNRGAEPGDVLILTKPLGIGVITTAIKQGKISPDLEKKVAEIMSTLNKSASEAMIEVGVNACTDVTGFGLLGHLWEMVCESNVVARLNLSLIPIIDETWDLVKSKVVPGGTLSNLKFVTDKVDWDDNISEEAKLILADAQTSGGLLISCPEAKKEKLLQTLESKGVNGSRIIGQIIEDKRCRIKVTT
jgi:selenide,water dikinase